jgi:Tfp pilus assembly protein PilX
MTGPLRRRLRRHQRSQRGFSTLAVAFVLLALTIPIVFIAESVLVAGRQATNNALGQENLRAVDAAMSEVMGEIRLDEFAVNNGCAGSPAGRTINFDRSKTRPKQGPLFIRVECKPQNWSAARRELTFRAYVRQNAADPEKILGQAKVKYLDTVGGASVPGDTVLVCDWRLGKTSGALASCPT